ncbi:type VII secretion protein EsaA [Psychrobacillus sp. FSL K6-2684]|uniref:type VII secretion protein EsaA n=1 Tax=Psychrobacillus sp. FSL K6-2684 TaxID=2921547 RepID=UPI0030F71360
MKNLKSSGLWKIVAGIVLILALPILFFQLMGVSILDLDNPNKRVIAIVNEDQGITKGQENIDMGVEVVTILATDSPYEWKVVGRGAAENGLKSNQYEAIVYIPSNFSSNIMSYDQQNPAKAEFSYKVHSQKAGLRKERVLHEIESASNRVNEKVSTLYWTYVAQEMDHIKKEFANILGKETEFLTTMSDYYKPESETLAEEMKRQKEQMAGLLSTISSANNSHASRIQNAETFGNQMDGFISYVQQYKVFQDSQKEILKQVQDDSLAKIKVAAFSQAEKFNKTVQQLEESNEKLNDEIYKVNEIIDVNQEKFNALSELRKGEVDRQLNDLLAVQKTAIDRYNFSVLNSLEKGIEARKNGTAVLGLMDIGTDPQQLNTIREEMERKAAAKSETLLPGLEEERTKVNEILTALQSLKTKVAETDPTSTLVTDLEQLQGELTNVTALISQKEGIWNNSKQEGTNDYAAATEEYKNLLTNYNTVYGEYKSVQQIIDTYPADTVRLGLEISQKEEALLNHAQLTAEQKTRLQELFSKRVTNTELSSLLSYYATLEQFEFTLNEGGDSVNKDALLEDEILTALLKNVVDVNDLELESWTAVEESIPQTQLGMTDLSTTFAAIMSGQRETVEEQHLSLLNDLDTIDKQANLLLQQIQNPATMLGTGEPQQTVGEGEVVSSQQNVSNQLLSLSEMMNTLSERQNNLVNYANDLHAKADDIKSTSNEFSSKWETNVDAMTDFDGDIQSFLANTYVDGQENGYAFNHFVNPLGVKGATAVSEDGQKVPPVILFIILLISSLLIGYFTYQLKDGAIGLRVAMTIILSVLVGIIISLYSVNMYILNDERAIQWTIFTVLLLLASASIVRAALEFGQAAGWLASIALMCVYIVPLLILAVPDVSVPDILSNVYLSIKYEADTNFLVGVIITGAIAIVMLVVSYFVSKNNGQNATTVDEAYES